MLNLSKERKLMTMRGIIYGVSSKYNFGWEHIVYGPFKNEEDADKWMQTEEYDFREREIMCKSAAIKLAGRKSVENATDPYEERALVGMYA